MTAPKVAIVYDWATTRYGGAEKVLAALHKAYPDAPLFTAVVNKELEWTKDWKVIPSFLQKIPGAVSHYKWLALLMPLAFESFDLSAFDVIISVTSASAKGVITLPHQLHVSYLLTPPRYLYTHREEYLPAAWLRWLATPFLNYMAWWDTAAAWRPDKVIALSTLDAQRIQTSYGRTADEVIYPPVELSVTATEPKNLPIPKSYFLVVSRLVKYKRIDLAIAACIEGDYELVIIGDGPERAQLEIKAQSNKKIHFLGHQPAEVTAWYQKHCTALLMPGIEDFGITAIETVAAGRPVILHQSSGAAEILDKTNAVFLTDLKVASLLQACQTVLETKYNQATLRQSVEKYATTTFVKKFTSGLETYWLQLHKEGTL